MKKLLVLFVIFICVPFSLKAYVKEDIETTFKNENISYDLSNYKASDEKVNVYLFRGQGCSHCEHFLEFVSNTLVKDYGDYFNLNSFEVWYNSENKLLMDSVAGYFNIEADGVPFIVIGDKYYSGYGESMNDGIIGVIKNEYENKNRIDVVKNALNGDVTASANIDERDTNNKNDDGNDENYNSSTANINNVSVEGDGLDVQFILIIVVVVVALIIMVYLIYVNIKLGKHEK